MVAPPQSGPLLLELAALLEGAGPEVGPDVPPTLDEPEEPGGTVLPVEDCGALEEFAALELSTVDPREDDDMTDDDMTDDDATAELEVPPTDDDLPIVVNVLWIFYDLVMLSVVIDAVQYDPESADAQQEAVAGNQPWVMVER